MKTRYFAVVSVLASLITAACVAEQQPRTTMDFVNFKGPVYFEFGSSAVAPLDDVAIRHLAKSYLQDWPAAGVPISQAPLIPLVGWCSTFEGCGTDNVKLSANRVEAVRRILRESGIPSDNITELAMGSFFIRSDNQDPETPQSVSVGFKFPNSH